MEYLITNEMTGDQTWTPAKSLSDALGQHENARRKALGFQPLPLNWAFGDGSGPNKIDGWLGSSTCYGLRCNVVREG